MFKCFFFTTYRNYMEIRKTILESMKTNYQVGTYKLTRADDKKQNYISLRVALLANTTEISMHILLSCSPQDTCCRRAVLKEDTTMDRVGGRGVTFCAFIP